MLLNKLVNLPNKKKICFNIISDAGGGRNISILNANKRNNLFDILLLVLFESKDSVKKLRLCLIH